MAIDLASPIGVGAEMAGSEAISILAPGWSRQEYRNANAEDLWDMQKPFEVRHGIAIALPFSSSLHFPLCFNRPDASA